ncbi:hypothetical protein Tcan_01756, partial [Toxocara canis]
MQSLSWIMTDLISVICTNSFTFPFYKLCSTQPNNGKCFPVGSSELTSRAFRPFRSAKRYHTVVVRLRAFSLKKALTCFRKSSSYLTASISFDTICTFHALMQWPKNTTSAKAMFTTTLDKLRIHTMN